MKIFFRILNVIIFVIILVSTLNASDEPVDKKNPSCCECSCIPHKYPAQLCNNGTNRSQSVCQTFPLNDIFLEGIERFPKFNRNLCFKYDKNSFPFFSGKTQFSGYNDTKAFSIIQAKFDTIIDGVPSEREYIIFDEASIFNNVPNRSSILDEVFKAWKENCPGTANEPVRGEVCCIKVRWSTELVDFEDIVEAGNAPAKVNKINHFDLSKKSGKNCNELDVGCDLEIILNGTRAFTRPEHPTMVGQMTDKQPTFFFFTDHIPKPIDKETKADYRNKYKYVSIEDALLHEIGHLLGFGHYDDKDVCNDKNVPISESIMAGYVKPNEKHGLSWKDRCAYKRANCCGNNPYMTNSDCESSKTNPAICSLYNARTSVFEYTKAKPIPYPNPADQWVFVPTTVEGNYSVEIYDYVGRQYFNGSLESFDSKIGIPVGHLSNGNYVIRVTMSKNIQEFSIVISR